MDPIDVVQKYFAAWNHRDPAAIVATFAEGGTYSDPVAGPGLTGPAIADYASGLFTAFPDLSFNIVSVHPTGDGMVAAQWLMRGTNTGPLAGNPPTGGTVALPGADFIIVADDKIRSVQGYFDQRTFVEQLGLQVIVQPYSIGPVSFGHSVYLQLGKRTKPGAFSLGWIQLRSDEEEQEVIERSRQIMVEMARMPGFISFMGVLISHRFFAITAWEGAENPRQLRQGGSHKEAMERFFGSDFAAAGHTSVWVPHRLNPMWVRCTACGRVAEYDQLEGKCQCNQPLPEHPPYW
jgi:steroid delta-isomerase-like uncharacterized protein